MKKLLTPLIIVCTLAMPFFVSAQQAMSSATYKIESDSVNAGGLRSGSASYSVEDTAGEAASGRSKSASFAAFNLGYQGMRTNIAATTVVPPTAPANLAAQAMSSSAIELTWDASTGDFGVVRYSIYRDGIKITDVADFPREYLDAGLQAGTAYSYTVSAVDSEGNESAQSLPATATTLAAPVVPGGGTIPPSQRLLSDFGITPSDTRAIVSFTTSQPIEASIVAGRDAQYKDVAVSENAFQTAHQILLDHLTPDTQYFLRLALKDQGGTQTIFENISFTTLHASFVLVTPNVSNLKVEAEKSDIALSWQNPLDPQVTGVRVVRSATFYPTTPTDGTIVAEGDLSAYTDTHTKAGVTYYYAVFAVDLTGTFSSGSVGSARIPLPGQVPATTTPIEILPQAAHVDPMIEALLFKNFLFIQSGDSVVMQDNTVTLDGGKNTTIGLTYYRLPAVLKTIAVTLVTHEADPRSFTFILRANSNKTRYEATIGPLGETRDYTVHVTVVDFKNEGQKKIDGLAHVVAGGTQPAQQPVTVPQAEGKGKLNPGILILILLILAALIVLMKKKLK